MDSTQSLSAIIHEGPVVMREHVQVTGTLCPCSCEPCFLPSLRPERAGSLVLVLPTHSAS